MPKNKASGGTKGKAKGKNVAEEDVKDSSGKKEKGGTHIKVGRHWNFPVSSSYLLTAPNSLLLLLKTDM